MPEIGATLRETRLRAGLDIADIEASTKIRAKYLRAIENEEWDLLPGPTFAKSFIRTYADDLGLDSRLLLEEYKLQHERYDEQELRPIPRTTTPGRDRRRQGGGPSGGGPRHRWLIVAGVVVVIVGFLIVLGGGSDDSSTSTERTTTVAAGDPGAATGRGVRLQIVPTAAVYTCLVGGGRRLINGKVLQPGTPSPTFRSRRFTLALGNGNARLRVDGRTVVVPGSSDPVGYVITSAGARPLANADRPICA